MWHNQEIMVGWKEVMTEEEFQEKQPKPLEKRKPIVNYDEVPVVPFDGSFKTVEFIVESKDITVVEEKILKFENKVEGMGYKYDHEASIARDEKSTHIDFHIYTKEAVPKRECCLAHDPATNQLTATHSVGVTTWGVSLDRFLDSTEGLRVDILGDCYDYCRV